MSSSGGTRNMHSTPSRDRERLPFPQSANPSPGPSLRQGAVSTSTPFLAPPTTSSSSSPSVSSSNQPLTVEALLKQHASALDPTAAALSQVVADRNVLSAQNAQLWKLIEKQRAGYNTILKELERIRADRDFYKNKYAVLTGTPNGKSRGGDRTARPSIDSQNGSSPAVHANNPRQGISRHHSDDNSNNGGSRLLQQPHQLHSSRSHEPLSLQLQEDSLQSNASRSMASSSPPLPPPASAPPTSSRTSRPSPTPLVVPPPRSSSSGASAASSTVASADTAPASHSSNNGHSQTPYYSNYPRKSSIADSVSSVMTYGSSAISSPSTTSSSVSFHNYSLAPPSHYTQPQQQTDSSSTSLASAGLSSCSTDSQQIDQRNRTSSSTTESQQLGPPEIITTPTPNSKFELVPPPSTQPQMLSTIIESNSRLHYRDSRISLPDEAKQYIANMGESPMPSPQVDSFARAKPNPPSPLATRSPSHNSSGVDSEFLDLDDDDDDDDDDNDNDDGAEELQDDVDMDERSGVHGPRDRGNDQPEIGRYPHKVHESDAEYQSTDGDISITGHSTYLHSRDNTESQGLGQRSKKEKPHAAAEDFPLPPTVIFQRQQAMAASEAQLHQQQLIQTPASAPSKHVQSMTDQQQLLSFYSDLDGSAPMFENPFSSGHGQPPPSSARSVRSESRQNDQQHFYSDALKPEVHPASFRALPLLSSDLPHTLVNVSHSFVRPNDRGKEVLSFIVFVNPGNGKEGWKVEKMYSDVLSLDQRVRSSVGKGVGKKIGSLPEGKLWRDHAPAKVDQRKIVLETYLQTLVNLPVKTNDEVIAFFTTDIVRETKQPVMQAGHKEGYLTKRGKNFGGWKTRYFVLQGPVLEYYDCRGGAHLGSITITSAQIGRQQQQQKSERTDEEKEYRHAFLIMEAKKSPSGAHPRHVLCAESDEDRDSWVEMLVRYVSGSYSEEVIGYNSNQPRASTSSSDGITSPSSRKPMRGMSKDDIKGAAMPQSNLNPDVNNNAKLFQVPPLSIDDYTRSSSPSKSMDPSPTNQHGSPLSAPYDANQNGYRILERGQGLPSSLPDASPLSAVQPFQTEASSGGLRANSELGHYPDLQDSRAAYGGGRTQRQQSPEKHRTRDPQDGRKSFYPTLNSVASSPVPNHPERGPSPDKLDANGKVKISGPLNGAPIPSGFKFGGKDAPSADAVNERREKTKSRSFWGFGKANGDKAPLIPYTSRAVFGVPLEDALEVSQICNLPAIVFRSIQYLEAKKADQEEGIYRLSGSSAVIKSLKDRFNTEGDVDLLASDEYWDPHAIAGLLKSFLRELPASILTRDLHLKFLAVIDFVDAQERIKELSHLIAALPIANYSLLRALTAHLILIVQNSSVNKMTMRNVGIVFSPTLGIPAGVFSLMLGEFNRVFNVDADTDDSGSIAGGREGLGGEHQSEPLRRNSRQYSDAAADQVLGLAGRSLTTSAEEAQSDGDDFSVQEESGNETAEGDPTVESSSSSSPAPGSMQHEVRVSPPETPTATRASKAANTAANRGLNVNVTHSERGNRHSRMMGLPSSPRPPHSPSRPPDVPVPPSPNRSHMD